MLAFRSLDPLRALREPDRRRRDEERLSRSEQRTLSKTQNNHLTGKAPYKFESGLLQRRVRCEPDFLSRVDHAGEVLDVLVQRRRDDSRAALRLMRKLLKGQGFAPRLLVTDKLRSYASRFRTSCCYPRFPR